MSNVFSLRFGSGQTVSGLSPTFIQFRSLGGSALTAPAITEISTSGIYGFTAVAASLPIFFVADGATTGLTNDFRYVTGQLDLRDLIDQTGITIISLVGAIGSTASSFGTNSVDPGDLFGYLKRLQELFEGNGNFNKTTGGWDMYSRGSSQLLRSKTLANSASIVTKT